MGAYTRFPSSPSSPSLTEYPHLVCHKPPRFFPFLSLRHDFSRFFTIFHHFLPYGKFLRDIQVIFLIFLYILPGGGLKPPPFEPPDSKDKLVYNLFSPMRMRGYVFLNVFFPQPTSPWFIRPNLPSSLYLCLRLVLYDFWLRKKNVYLYVVTMQRIFA